MRSATFSAILVASAVLPSVLAAPSFHQEAHNEARDVEARAAFGAAAKALGGGIASGGLFAVLGGLLGKLTGGGEAPARRDLTTDEAALLSALMQASDEQDQNGLQARGGVPSGIGKAALTALKAILGFGKARRDLDGELTTEEEALVAAIMSQDSGLQARGGVPSGIGKAALTAIKAILGFGKARRDVADAPLSAEEETLLNMLMEAQAEAGARKRALPSTGASFSRRAPAGAAGAIAKSGFGKLIGTSILGGIGSALAGTAIGQLFQRDISELTPAELELMEALMAAESDNGLQARAPLALGGLAKGLAGTVAGLGASVVAGGLFDSLLAKFKGQRRELEDLSPEELAQLEAILTKAPASINDLD